MSNWILLFFSSVFALVSCGQDSKSSELHRPVETVDSFQLGSRFIKIHQSQYGNSGLTMINMHDDETTSVEAARIVLATTGGKLIRIENDNQRLISFSTSGKSFRFDPNRMFTTDGLVANLKKLNTTVDPDAVKNISAFSNYFLSLIDTVVEPLIALHNNNEGNLTINSYRPGGNFVTDAKKINVGRDMDPDNFFLTTDEGLYQRLAEEKQNVVLQDNEKAVDDGSMSIYYGKRGMKYVNVEAQLGDIQSQVKMLRLMVDKLKERGD